MSHKCSKPRSKRKSNPFLEIYHSFYLGSSKLSLGEINFPKIENMLVAISEVHQTMGKQIIDLASVIGAMAAENKKLQNKVTRLEDSVEKKEWIGNQNALKKRGREYLGEITTFQITQKRKKFLFLAKKNKRDRLQVIEDPSRLRCDNIQLNNSFWPVAGDKQFEGCSSIYKDELFGNNDKRRIVGVLEPENVIGVKKLFKRKNNNLIQCSFSRKIETRSAKKSKVNSCLSFSGTNDKRSVQKIKPPMLSEYRRKKSCFFSGRISEPLMSPFKGTSMNLKFGGETEAGNGCENSDLCEQFYKEISNGSEDKYDEIKMGFRTEVLKFQSRLKDDIPEFEL